MINSGKLYVPLLVFISVSVVSCAQVTTPMVETAETTDGGMTEHYVPVVSRVPSMTGSVAQLYVRERASDETRNSSALEGRVVLFVHGAGTPAEVAFDPPFPEYSWMAYLAERGMDVFSVDMTGYGRSTRPLVMNDRCNLSPQQQEALFGDACSPSYPFAATSMDSDWHDIDAAVDYIRELRGVETVHLVGWSQGGPRTGGYAAMNPDKVGNIVVLAPAYRGDIPAMAGEADFSGAAMTKQSLDDFTANWDRQVGCSNQYRPEVSDAVWSAMMASDPIGATWGTGVRRAPRSVTFGWNAEMVANTSTPIMMVAGTQDAQVAPQLVRNLYNDHGAEKKIYLEMSCSSHNAMWEEDAQQLFDASFQWLTTTSYNGQDNGMIIK